MVRIGLQIKANLENVTNLGPDGDDFRWYMKLQCGQCGEVTDTWQYVSLLESSPLKGGRGNASLVSKCKLCKKENSIDILKDFIKPYRMEENNQFQTVVAFDCRGMVPVKYSFRSGFQAEGVDSPTKFGEIDLQSEEWADYDEHTNQSVGIYELESKFTKV
ncbi:CXXC motif containing zinc binding protein-like isoform X2 [Diadema antillarum]|uniref:CXXC motif containing zinc binding protein-like isoform X2 n=1 Tax=Diadema antillarum TaxID=105358 RepID=UPI003A8C53C6